MEQFFAQFNAFFAFIGLPPELFGSAVCVAILLRFARASLEGFGPSKTYLSAVGVGILAGVYRGYQLRPSIDGVPAAALAFIAAVLLVQFALQKAGDKFDWLPADNQWVKKDPPKEAP